MKKDPTYITLTELDHVRLSNLLTRQGLDDHPLQDILIDAVQVPSSEVPANLVTMLSQVEIEFTKTKETQSLFLNYPDEADIAKGHVSILSPLGTALIGHVSGTTVNVQSPNGSLQPVKILDVKFQPEANGDFTA